MTDNGYGVWLDYSSGNIISGNTFTNDGLAVYYSYQNSVEDNTVNGKPLVYLEGVTNYSVGDAGQVVLVRCDSIRVENLNLSRASVGVQLWETNSSTISWNNMTANSYYGVWLDYSSSNIISGNSIAANSYYGVWLDYSSGNIISGNSIAANSYYGVWLDYSSGNIISGNTFTDDGLFVGGSYQNSVEDNTVNGKPLVYLEGVTNYSVGDAGQVVLVRCDSIRVENLNLSRASVGVQLWETNSSTISWNNITNNDDGVWLDYSFNNEIYHNSFINNTSQVSSDRSVNVWDDGYPSGGNYWSDYTCLDLYKGPYQNETSSDGIGDASYVIDANNTDRYPLMKPYPWGPHDVGVTYIGRCYEIGVSILIYPLRTVAGLNILLHLDVFVMNYGDYTEVLDLTMYANSTIISQVSNVTLAAKNSTILDVLWDTSGFEMGNYTLSAYLKSVPGDSDVKDNNYTDGHIIITIPGDLNGDFKVSLVDLVILAQAYGSKPGDSNWNPNADIDDNGIVRLSDLVTLAQDYGRTS
jgi:parallel beta-helix repeat protein